MNDKTAIEAIRALKRNVENDMPDYDYGWDAAIDEAIKALAALEAENPAADAKAREALVEIANQEVGTWDKPVPFSVLYRRSVDIAREAIATLDAEKPGEDADAVACRIEEIQLLLNDGSIMAKRHARMVQEIRHFAEAYHAAQCKACNDFCARAKEHCEDRESPLV